MRIENFFSHYKKQLIDRQKQVEQSILGGLCKSWEDYKYLTGKLAALKQEEQELTDLLKKTELDDE
jgi:cell shape-determining protein MreC|tara:strand:- start:194 stop:391 length:198 start_codon:yes stop_codon:yes gene_type:complete